MTPEEIAAAEAAAKAEADKKAAEEKKFTQAELEQHIKDRLEREKKKTEEATAKAKADAEAEAAKKNGEFQKLAEQREKELAEATSKLKGLEDLQAQLTEMSAAMQKVIDTQTATLPDPVKELLKGLSPVKQLEWLAKNAGTFTSGTTQQNTQKPGGGALPDADPGKPAKPEEIVNQKARRYGPVI